MGVVYKAEDLKLGRLAARIKTALGKV